MVQNIIFAGSNCNNSHDFSKFIKENGFNLIFAENHEELNNLINTESISLIVIDIPFGEDPGFEIIRKLRAKYNLPMIIVSEKTDTIEKVIALEMGADDFVNKPFEQRELLARIRAVCRRVINENFVPEYSHDNAEFEGWTLIISKRKLISPSKEVIHLTSAEYDLLRTFVEANGKILKREDLIAAVYKNSSDAFERSIDVLVMRLRKKIEQFCNQPQMIKTARGQGYIFLPNVMWQ